MFQYIDELFEITHLPKEKFDNSFKLTWLGVNILYVSAFIKILSYSTDTLILKIKDNELNIQGVNLQIVRLSGAEIILNGQINKVFLSKEYSNEAK